MSSIKDILTSMKPRPHAYKVKAWDGIEVFVRALTEKERAECGEGDDATLSAKDVVLRGLVDAEGNQVFDNTDEMDPLTLGGILEIQAAIFERTMYRGEDAEKNS